MRRSRRACNARPHRGCRRPCRPATSPKPGRENLVAPLSAPHARARLLHWFGKERRRWKLDELTLESGRVFCPDLAHRLERFPCALDLFSPRNAQDLEVFVQGALARTLSDAELQPAVAQHIDAS